MKKHIVAVGLGLMSLTALIAQTDPVLLTVNGKDVPLSEFEYLFHKNNSQQAAPQQTDEYLNMFIDYKLKVADAESQGLDTTAAFLEEFNQFRGELSAPYLKDKGVEEALLQEIYTRMGQERTVSHIMVQSADKVLADSLYQLVKSGKAPFADMARAYSIDKPSAVRGGVMGIVKAGRFPKPFEDAVYAMCVGELSEPVNSGFGWHIIRLDDVKPARGEVLASHILRSTRNLSDSAAAAEKLRIDSIYAVLVAHPEEFGVVAAQLSQDPGSASRGGSLGWFGAGVMVQPFDSIAFAMDKGTISQPFETPFGWHIINKLDSRGIASYDELRPQLLNQLNASDAAREPELAYQRDAIQRFNGHLVDESFAGLAEMIGGQDAVLDSATMKRLAAFTLPAFVIDGKTTTIGEVAKEIKQARMMGADLIAQLIQDTAQEMLGAKAMELAREQLYLTEPDYRNLVNEYRDGILLFEVSNQNVWEKAAQDKAGLEAYFNANRDKYQWESPKFKSFVIFTPSDSLMSEVMTYIADFPAGITKDELGEALRKKFGRDVKVEKVLAAKGENKITDYLGFGQPKPADADGARWKSYAAFQGHVYDQPQEAADVRSAILPDYQAVLEKAWLEKLHKKFKVKVNKKVLKLAK